MRFPKASRVTRPRKNKSRKRARNAPSTRPSRRPSDAKVPTNRAPVNGRIAVCSVGFSQELASIRRRFAGIFVFAVSVDVHALTKPRVEALFPGAELLRRVVF